jgi:hypothetical protein
MSFQPPEPPDKGIEDIEGLLLAAVDHDEGASALYRRHSAA